MSGLISILDIGLSACGAMEKDSILTSTMSICCPSSSMPPSPESQCLKITQKVFFFIFFYFPKVPKLKVEFYQKLPRCASKTRTILNKNCKFDFSVDFQTPVPELPVMPPPGWLGQKNLMDLALR